MASLSDDNIQAQIEAKKRRLEELKQKRLQRQLKQDEPSAPASAAAGASSSSPLTSPRRPTSALSTSQSLTQLPSPSSSSSFPAAVSTSDDILDVVNSLITSSPSPHPPTSGAAAAPSSAPSTAAASAPRAALAVQAQPSLTVLPVECVFYEVGTQTSESYLVEAAAEEERKDEPHSPAKRPRKAKKASGIDSDEEEELRKECDTLRHRETELMTTIKEMKSDLERRRAEEEAAQQPRLLSAGESDELMRREDFGSFFARSSLMMERALAERERRGGYDYTVDYADDDADADAHSHVETLVYRLTFDDPTATAQRTVSALDWSGKYSELMLAAYASTDDDDAAASALSSGAQGCVLLWNINLTSRPEFHFTSDSSIVSAFFHPTQPRLVIGASASGQLLMWDTRSKATPVNRTSLANSHSFPITGLRQHAGQTVSVSSDGHVCYWQDENWHLPSTSYHLQQPQGQPQQPHGELSVSAMDIHAGVMFLGSDDGRVYKARMHGEGDHVLESLRAHDAPITSLSFQPTSATAQSPSASSLYLTSSYDWTVKLFAHHAHSPLASFESARDYAYDAQWHPTHPGVFVTGDSTGKMDLWRLGGRATAGGVGAASAETGAAGEGGEGVTGKGWEVPQYSVMVGDAGAAQLKTSGEVTGAGGEGVAGEGGRAHALSKLRWHGDGSMLSVGTSRGAVSVWELNKEVADCSCDEQERLWEFITKQLAQPTVRAPTLVAV